MHCLVDLMLTENSTEILSLLHTPYSMVNNTGGYFASCVVFKIRAMSKMSVHIIHSFFIRTCNFGAEAERSYFFHDLRLKMFSRRS